LPVEIPPQRIEISQLDGGFIPDPPESLVPLNAAPDMTNLLPDPYSHNPEVRKGFERVANGRLSTLGSSYYIKHVRYYEYISGGSRKRWLVCILTNGQDNTADNVQVWAYNLEDSSFARVDTAARSWAKANTPHWYAVVEGTYYGGTRGEKIYSWNGTTWNADPTTPDVKTWTSSKGNAVNTATEFGRNYAFKAKTQVKYGTKYYTSARNIRYKTWETDEHYSKGEKVSRKVDHGSSTYWRSFVAIDDNNSSAVNRPGDGTGSWQDSWKNVSLKDVEDEDGELTEDWNYNPLPGKTSVGTFYGFRMWVRHDDSDNWTRIQWSEPARPEKNEDIADLVWKPKRWAFADDTDGDGGGYVNIPFKRGDAIRALVGYGNYILIFGRWETHVIAGINELTWTNRLLSGESGTIGIDSVCEHEGLVYYLTPGGMLYRTDGTSSEPVENTAAVREYLKTQIDFVLTEEDTYHNLPCVWSYGRKVWLAFPGTGVTLAYDPDAGSWWKTDLPIQSAAVGAADRASRMFFSTYWPGSNPTVFTYLDDPGDEQFTDDDVDGGATKLQQSIPVLYRTAWFEFGQFRTERRVRRTWAILNGAAGTNVTLSTHKNFDEDTIVATRTTALSRDAQGEYVEGSVPDSAPYSFALDVSADVTDDFSLTGFGVDTETQRDRFHRTPS
jgi:hypothetical protein